MSFIENFKHMAKLKELYSKQLDTHHLDSTVGHFAVLLPIHPSILQSVLFFISFYSKL